jgi:pyruvate/2-oxoglutarate/acetoin dehydrogenase E1 component
MRTVTFTVLLRETLAAEMRRDPNVFLIGEDIATYGGAFGVTRGLADEFGTDRVRDTPISEQALVGSAIGAAVGGSRPVVEIMFADFVTLAVDQLANMAAKLRYIFGVACPLVVRLPTGGGRGYGATHSQTPERLFTGVPGLRIAAPSTAGDASALLQTAIRDPNPVLFLEHKMLYPLRWDVADALPAPIPFGRAAVTRAGTDITIIAWSYMAHLALHAAGTLAAEDVSAEVVDLRTLCPLDTETIVASARKTGRVLIVEEGPLTGGFAAEIACRIFEAAYDSLDAPIRRLASTDSPVPAARNLEAAALPDAARIVAAARTLAAG